MKRTLATLATAALLGSGLVATTSPSASAAPPFARAFGLTATDQLVSFRLNAPGQVQTIGAVRGLGAERSLVGMDIRPATGALYAVGRQGGLFIINKQNASARKVGQLSEPLQGSSFGVDVNPAADALRIVSNTGQNLRYSFAARTTTVDTPLNTPDVDGTTRGITAAAYTNNDTSDVTGTALYDISSAADTLVLQVPANGGAITTVGQLRRNAPAQMGFDIRSTLQGERTVGNEGFATFGSSLYRIDLTTGEASAPRTIGKNRRITDLAVVQPRR